MQHSPLHPLRTQHIQLPKHTKPKPKYFLNLYQPPKNKLRFLQYFSHHHSKNASTEANSTSQSTCINDKGRQHERKSLKRKEKSKVKEKSKIKKIKSQKGEKCEKKSLKGYLADDIILRIREQKTMEQWKELLKEYRSLKPRQEHEVQVIWRQLEKVSEMKQKQEEKKYKILSLVEQTEN